MNEGHLKEVLRQLDIKPISKNYKGWVLCRCPFAPFNHDGGKDLNPSFYVRIDNQKLSGYNCFGGEVKFLTDRGALTFKEAAGGRYNVLAPDGSWVEASVELFGQDEIVELTLTRNGRRKVIQTTRNHRWFLRPEKGGQPRELTTEHLKTNHRLQVSLPDPEGHDYDQRGKFLRSRRSYDRVGWKVVNVRPTGITSDVYCARVPDYGAFTLEDYILTGNCYTCKEHGSIRKLILRLGHLRDEDYSELAQYAFAAETPEKFDAYDTATIIEDEEVEPLDKSVYFNLYPEAKTSEKARAYLDSRRVSVETAIRCNLRWDENQQRVLFPILDHEQELWGFSGRLTFPSKEYPKVRDYGGLRKERHVLGEHLIDPDSDLPILVVEGLFAWLWMMEIRADKFCHPVATLGANMSDWQAEIIASYEKTVVMLYDNDSAGDDGLYGTWDEHARKHSGKGAVSKLKPHVTTLVGLYPDHVDDPDNLRLYEVQAIVEKEHELA